MKKFNLFHKKQLKNKNKKKNKNINKKKKNLFEKKQLLERKKLIQIELEMLKKPFPYLNYPLNPIIPLQIYQTWYTKNLPLQMKKNIELIQKQNPEFNYHLYDDEDCRLFIEEHFSKDVLSAFDRLIPGAYKADLWRYCILYKLGGIYLDIKYRCANGFKFIYLTDKEYFCTDFSNKTLGNKIDVSESGIYNALLICKPENEIMKKCIDMIVENVQTSFYGTSYLEPTGPLLVDKFFTIEDKEKMILNHYARNKHVCIRYGLYKILDLYPEYRNEQNKFSNKKHYSEYWLNKNIYLTL